MNDADDLSPCTLRGTSPPRCRGPVLVVAVIALVSVAASLAAAPTASAVSPDVVISEVYGGGSGESCGGPAPRIGQIQGGAHLSPCAGLQVRDVRGVVTAVRNNGFWFQNPTPDTDPATSEGLFVFTSSAPQVRAGDDVSVNGTVTEFRPGGASTANLTTTELTAPAVTVLGSQTILAPTVIGPGGRVPPGTVIDDDATGNVETSGTFDPATDGIDFYESLEGMHVQLNNPVAVGPSNDFGEIPVLADDGAGAGVRTARGGILLRQSDPNPERILLDDALQAGSTPGRVHTGDHFSGPATGVLDYSFGNFKLLLNTALTAVPGGITRESTTPAKPTELSVGTFNVENLDPTDPQSKFDALARMIVFNLAAPGILAIEEIQDNDGPANTSVVDAAQTWGRLITAIRAAGGPAYDYRDISPVDDADGGEPGGNIRVGFLFRTDVGLQFVPGAPGDATTPVSVFGTPNPGDPVQLTHNPGRIDPANPAWASSRKPLVGEFRFHGAPLFVIANHWNSKGGDQPLFGHFQPPQQTSQTQRSQQAQVVAGFVRQVLAIDPQARIVVAGDLNDFEYSGPVRTLIDAGLTDLPGTLPDAERYTYVFEGNSQVLDHILLSDALARGRYSYDVVHANAEFADQVSDHDPQVVRLPM